jgi:ubiquinone/menaquinone biosynthesis C-methylase UbiE
MNMTKTDAEARVSKFYNTVGWVTEGGVTEDAKRFEDLRPFSQEYARKTRMRVFDHIPEQGDHILDMASGPIQYQEYIEYSQNFAKRHCVDFSMDALNMAKEKIGDHGQFWHGNFLNMDMEENFFDCALSLHTIYHIDKEEQEQAVRKLLHVTKPGKPVIIVYSNPKKIWSRSLFRRLKKGKKNKKAKESQESNTTEAPVTLYFYQHPNSWWKRFKDSADVKILPWRAFGPMAQRKLIPNNKLGKFMFKILFKLEDWMPTFFANNFEYNMIVLTKKAA